MAISIAASNAHSIAESTVSQLDTKIRANKEKAKLKQLLKNVDQDKSGKVKESVFLTICQLHGVTLSTKDQAQLSKRFSNGGNIKYKEALAELQIDMASAVNEEVKWIVSQHETKEPKLVAENNAAPVTSKTLRSLLQKDTSQKEAKSVRSKAQSVTGSKLDLNSKHEFILKNKLDFPDYTEGLAKGSFVQQEADFIQKTLAQDNSVRRTQQQAFVSDLWKNDRTSYFKLVEILELLSACDVDLRQLSQFKSLFFDAENGQEKDVTVEKFKDEINKVLAQYHGCDLAVEKIMAFVKVLDDQTKVYQSRVNTLIEFAKCYPFHVKKVKTASTGMDLVMSYDPVVTQQKKSVGNVQIESSDNTKTLAEFVWTKIMERHRNATSAFRSFDFKGKGKVKKAHLIEGFEKLRIRLSAKDIDAIWSLLDNQNRGYINFNEFCILQDIKTSFVDNLSMKVVETRVQDNLAAERKAERDKIAQEMLEKLSSAGSLRGQQRQSQQTFGVLSLPSEDITALINNRWNHQYLHDKMSHDDSVQHEKAKKLENMKRIREAHAQKLKNEAIRASVEVANKKVSDDATVLPPIPRNKSSAVNTSLPVKPSQHILRHSKEIAATQPKDRLLDRVDTSSFSTLQPAFISGSSASDARTLKDDLIRNYLSQKQQLKV